MRTLIKSTILISVVAVLHMHCFAQAENKAVAKIEINTTKLNQAIDSIFSYMDQAQSPGCAVTVLQDGKVITQKDYGMASIELSVPFDHNTVVRIPYSEGREFISIAAVLMEQDGILELDNTVRSYFPDLPDWSQNVTLWDLLNHRSGFVDEWATLLLYQNSMSNRFETEQFLRLLYTQPEPEIEPGKGYMYCNSDFGLLRLIMEKASGQNLVSWMQQRIFLPLQMQHTQMQNNPLDVIAHKADMYSLDNSITYRHQNVQKTSPGGNYFILTNASDLALWAAAIHDLTSEIHAAYVYLLENVRTIPGKENHYVTGYSLRDINSNAVVFHEGVNGYNYLTRITSQNVSVISIGNRDEDGFAIENKAITDWILGVPPPYFPPMVTEPVTVSAEELQKYAGKYRWLNQVSWEGTSQHDKFSTVFFEDGVLKMRYSGNYIIDLIPVGKDLFYYEEGFGMQVKFYRIMVNSPLKIAVTFDDGFPGVTMALDNEEPWKPAAAELKEYSGRYYSKHLDYYWNIEMNSAGKLILRRQGLPDAELEPDGKDQFYFIGEKYPGAGFNSWITFNRDAGGTITRITVSSGRVMHHIFDKV